MKPIIIRPTQTADVPLLPAIERAAAQAFLVLPQLAWLAEGNGISEKEHRQFVSTGKSFVALEGAVPVGFLLAERLDNALYIVELSVAQHAQNQGIGRQLIHFLAERARDEGYPALTLTTFKTVPWNAPFYARLGFEEIEEAQLTPGLRQKLANEAAHGLKRESRCAMRREIIQGYPQQRNRSA